MYEKSATITGLEREAVVSRLDQTLRGLSRHWLACTNLFWGTLPDADGDEVCDEMYAIFYPSSCQPCAHDGEAYCVPLQSWKVSGSMRDITLEEVDGIDDGCLVQ